MKRIVGLLLAVIMLVTTVVCSLVSVEASSIDIAPSFEQGFVCNSTLDSFFVDSTLRLSWDSHSNRMTFTRFGIYYSIQQDYAGIGTDWMLCDVVECPEDYDGRITATVFLDSEFASKLAFKNDAQGQSVFITFVVVGYVGSVEPSKTSTFFGSADFIENYCPVLVYDDAGVFTPALNFGKFDKGDDDEKVISCSVIPPEEYFLSEKIAGYKLFVVNQEDSQWQPIKGASARNGDNMRVLNFELPVDSLYDYADADGNVKFTVRGFDKNGTFVTPFYGGPDGGYVVDINNASM